MQIYLKKLQLESGKQTINTRFQTLDNQINSISIQIQNAEREYKRISSLLNDGAATGKQKDDIEGSLHLLKAQRKALESQKATLYAEKKGINVQIAQLEDQVKKSRIINPIEGIVLQQYKRQGEIVGPGQAIYKVANMDQLILRAYVSGYQLSELSLGAKLKVRIDAGDEIKELSGEVRWIASEAEFTPKIIQTREERVNLVYAVKVAVENDGSLKIGMPGEIKF
jgi:HlyD family secretion protein